MPYDRRKRRTTAAAAAERHRLVSTIKRTVLVMLPAWLAYFFAVNLFGRSLDRVMVPYLDMPLGTDLVILGSALTFPLLLYLMTRAFAVGRA
jgi:hypothetical protein